jgi:hypothetical protein
LRANPVRDLPSGSKSHYLARNRRLIRRNAALVPFFGRQSCWFTYPTSSTRHPLDIHKLTPATLPPWPQHTLRQSLKWLRFVLIRADFCHPMSRQIQPGACLESFVSNPLSRSYWDINRDNRPMTLGPIHG